MTVVADLERATHLANKVDEAFRAMWEARADVTVAVTKARQAGAIVPPLPFEVAARTKRQWWVYAIQPVAGGPIKIGKAHNVRGRLASLSIGSPVPLRLLGSIEETPGLNERSEHLRLAKRRLHGEWFDITVDDLGWLS